MNQADLADAFADPERAVLSAMLHDSATIPDVVAMLRADDFGKPHNGDIFASICRLHEAGRPVELVTVADDLHRAGLLDAVGGAKYLADVWSECSTPDNFEHYAKMVREESLFRKLGRIGSDLVLGSNKASRSGSAEELLSDTERLVLDLSVLGASGVAVHLSDAVSEWADRLDARATAGDTGIRSGFIDLDGLTAGFQPSELVIIAARPSVGKTAYIASVIRNVLMAGDPVFFASLEQSRIEVADRLIAAQSGVNTHQLKLRPPTRDECDKLSRARGELSRLPLHIDDWAVQPMSRIAANARRLKLRHGIKMVAVDYLQLIQPDDKRIPLHEQIAEISRRLKHLARELKIPVVALAQLNRASEARADKRPMLSELKGSGSLEQDADTVLLLSRSIDDENILEIDLAKQRNGPTGMVRLYFRKECMRFENYAQHPGY